ncbi:MAG: hypothetical protein N2512_02830 [Armatimonadetes bacterium]|nr:hypothetical protein [Armatimonadota bacterium]
MPDLRDRVREHESPLQRLLDLIPGFAGYREKELRRRADQLLRDHLAGLLDGEKAKLQRRQAELSHAARLEDLGPLDRAIGLIQKVRDKIRYADYGYVGWFDTPKINERELDDLYEYDLSMREKIGAIQDRVRRAAGAEGEELRAALADLSEALNELDELIDRRGDVIARLMPE